VSLIVISSALLIVLGVVGVLVVTRLSALRGRVRILEGREGTLERELEMARSESTEAEADQQQLARFVRELPLLVQELHAAAGARHIPRLLLSAVTRSLNPKKAIVAVRRRSVEGDAERHMRLAVAAVHPPGWIEVGSEIRIGQGEIGYAAEVQRVMERRDFENMQPYERKKLREETEPGCMPDVVAPMICKEEVVGVVCVEGARRGAKDALRLLAQVGAVSVETQARYVEMKATASIDGLTGIFNKRYLSQRLAAELHRAMDQSSCLSLFIFDVDHFKRYNDRNGHVAGDRLLRELAKVVQSCIRRDALFGRYGGEEFLILFPSTTRRQALAAAENVRFAVANHPFEFGALQPLGIVTVSGGVAEGPEDGRDAAALVSAADAALYRAKAAGRNRVLAHEPTYLGESEPLAPVTQGEEQLVAVAPDGDFTPEPGALLSLASITPAGGIKLLTEQPTAEQLSTALVAVEPNGSARAPAAESPQPPGPDATQRIKGEPLFVMDWDEMARRSEDSKKH
jgi:diguanylate cyclase (GGDEF)-like protein